MRIVQLTDTLSVSEQISPDDVAAIAAAGFKVLVNNRPDGEAPEQPGSDAIAVAAQAAGLSYYYLPVTAPSFPGPDVGVMASLLDNTEAPVLAFCRTGTRCTNLWVTTRGDDEVDAAVGVAKKLGYDLAMSGRS
ncbi:MAG: TIGR01244 family sulfur transferase [Halioglobus sp.]